MKSRLIAASTLLATFWAAGAHAAPITVNFTGFQDGREIGTIAATGVREPTRVAAGQFDFDVEANGTGDMYWDDELQAFCIDVGTNLVTSSITYDLVDASTYLGGEQLSLIGQLFDARGGSLTDGVNDARFQLSLWEIIYDSDGPSLDLGDGQFTATGFSSQATAQSWLSELNLGVDYESTQYEFFVLLAPFSNSNPDARTSQTLLTWRPIAVPEPGALLLLGSGLIGIAFTARRRRRS